MLNHFNFKRFRDKVLVTNDLGEHAFLTPAEFTRLLTREESLAPETAGMLRERRFLIDPMDIYSDEIVRRLRGLKSYVFDGTSLHIFVVTNGCNMRCVYCQAQSDPNHPVGMMTAETGRAAVDVALQSPSRHLCFEFQGGEPLLNFPVIRQMVEYCEAVKGDREVDYSIVTNLTLLTDEMAEFFEAHRVSVSTSLDGPRELHDQNRVLLSSGSSYDAVESGLRRLTQRGVPVGAIQTTTRLSLKYPREIVRAYYDMGLSGVFLRPLTPLGFAKGAWDRIGYAPEEFLAFYRSAFDEILSLNADGVFFPELHSTYFLKKILCGHADNYMELRSPCGAGIGQLAYYHDGQIYTCDEARMVAEAGNPAFCLGNVRDSDLRTAVCSENCTAVCKASVLESIPGCCDCVYQPYCGVCPVVNYAQGKDLFAKDPFSYRCAIYGGILDHLFSLIAENDETVMTVLRSWVAEDDGAARDRC